jgi:hypothetical protein
VEGIGRRRAAKWHKLDWPAAFWRSTRRSCAVGVLFSVRAVAIASRTPKVGR